jgi:hypothetical protein
VFVPANSVLLQSKDHALLEETTWFKCPETQYQNEPKAIGLSYDIWSAGWTLYEICSLNDPRDMLDKVDDFFEWTRPDIPRFYTREVDRIFKM